MEQHRPNPMPACKQMHEPERSHLPARPTRTAELASTEMRLVHHVHAAQKCVAAAEAATAARCTRAIAAAVARVVIDAPTARLASIVAIGIGAVSTVVVAK